MTIAVGPMHFDMNRTGTTTLVTLSVARPVRRPWLGLEGTVGYAFIREQLSGSPTRLGVIEGQVQVQLPRGPIRPYIGAGAGWVQYLSNASGRGPADLALVGGAGVRVPLGAKWGLRADGRLRGWDLGGTDWAVNRSTELTFGLTRFW